MGKRGSEAVPRTSLSYGPTVKEAMPHPAPCFFLGDPGNQLVRGPRPSKGRSRWLHGETQGMICRERSYPHPPPINTKTEEEEEEEMNQRRKNEEAKLTNRLLKDAAKARAGAQPRVHKEKKRSKTESSPLPYICLLCWGLNPGLRVCCVLPFTCLPLLLG